jgi:hypothetical protein
MELVIGGIVCWLIICALRRDTSGELREEFGKVLSEHAQDICDLLERIETLEERAEMDARVQAQLGAIAGDMFTRTRNIQGYENYLRQHGNLPR